MISPAPLGPKRPDVFSGSVNTGVALSDADRYASLTGMAEVRSVTVCRRQASAILTSIRQLVSINAVPEINLSGKAIAKASEGELVRGHGGTGDFQRSARTAVLGIPLVDDGRAMSRIGLRLAPVTRVSNSKADVDIFVAQHNLAPLRGLWLAGHAHAPLGNAGPRQQVWLRKAAR